MKTLILSTVLSLSMLSPVMASVPQNTTSTIPVALPTSQPDVTVDTDVMIDGVEVITGFMSNGLNRCPYKAAYMKNPQAPSGMNAYLVVGGDPEYPMCVKREHYFTQDELLKAQSKSQGNE